MRAWMTRFCLVSPALIGASLAVGGGPSDADDSGLRLTQVQRADDAHLVDAPPRGGDLTAGDVVVFHATLKRGTRSVGRTVGSCTVVRSSPQLGQCELTFMLREGAIQAAGAGAGASTRALRLAVVGGTGRYSGRRGEVRITPTGDDEQRLEFRFR